MTIKKRDLSPQAKAAIEADIREGMRLRREADAFSPENLAVMFELVFEGETIKQGAKRVANVLYGDYLTPDAGQIINCWEDRQDNKVRAQAYSEKAIAKRHGVSNHTVNYLKRLIKDDAN